MSSSHPFPIHSSINTQSNSTLDDLSGIERTPSLEPRAMSVSELTQRIKNQLEMAYPNLCVQGELSNFKRQASGHLYFSLKDSGAQIQVVVFQSYAQKLAFEPKDGDQVVVRGQLTVYNQRGQYQIVAQKLEKVGLGEILLRLETLKKELKALGWLDPSKKRPLPTLPERIGVVSSPTGAVIRDILHVLRLRHPGFNLVLYPARVQGQEAAQEVANGIRFLNHHKLCDVIIIARGGGSFEDLMPFNERVLLEAVHNSQIPIISAVGHETDFTLCDYVADVRAPTPSAAAERVMPSKNQLQDKLNYLSSHLNKHVLTTIYQHKTHLNAIKRHSVLANPLSLTQMSMQRLDELRYRIQAYMRERVGRERARFEYLSSKASPFILHTLLERSKQHLSKPQVRLQQILQERISQARYYLSKTTLQIQQQASHILQTKRLNLRSIQARHSPVVLMRCLERCRAQLKSQQETLQALSPESALRRGYAILRNKQCQGIRQANDIICGEIIEIEMMDAKLWSIVQRIEFKNSEQILPPYKT